MTDKSILFDSRGFMGDPALRACSAEAIGVLYLITMINPSCELNNPCINHKSANDDA